MSTATQCKPCEAQSFPNLKGTEGISDQTWEQHQKLYQGYVNNVNTVAEKLGAFISASNVGSPEYAELKRRLGWEINGVVLHELYFENIKANGGAVDANSKLGKALVENFGSLANWEADFKATGMMRGIGWAVMYQCCKSGRLINMWIGEHEIGHPAGATPVMVMDVWEHAYSVDHLPTGRKAYIDAFFKNVDWKVIEGRLN